MEFGRRFVHKAMLVSIIIPAHNAEATLALCLKSCMSQTYAETEIIVVDDGSADSTASIAESFGVKCVNQKNAGPAAARNAGARKAEGGFLAFTDADCIPATDWVEQLVRAMHDDVAGTGGTYAIANAENLLARMVHEEIAVRHRDLDGEVDFLGSFNVMYTKDAFEGAGGFDESFKAASGEDNDLAYRIIDNGHKLVFTSAAVVTHFHPTKLLAYLKTQARHGFWRMKLYAKHPKRAPAGDKYAGVLDLAAPALSLLALACFTLVVAAVPFPALFRHAAKLFAVVAVLYFATRLPCPVRMYKRSGDISMLAFVAVSAMRDVARALGMLRGIWHFLIKRRTSL